MIQFAFHMTYMDCGFTLFLSLVVELCDLFILFFVTVSKVFGVTTEFMAK